MEAIGLNPIRLDAIGIDPIRLNAIRLGVPGASSGSSVRPYIDPEVLASLVAVCICDGKSNDDPDRAVIKNLVDPDNPFVISNAAYTKGSGYADKDSPYYGALVTDGVDDLIVSSKTVQEMLDGSNEITVVSMIHHITGTDVSSFNSVRNFTSVTGRNKLNINNKPINKTGIYGWSRSNLNTVQATTMINNILGDNKDYQTINNDILSFDSIYSIEGYNAENGAQEVSQVAWYWTFIANRVLTTDEINQVIAYYNLDKYVKPDVYYDVKKQGLSNNTPDEDWYLKDYSGNGRDMQLYNYGKTPESGINEEGGLQSDGITDYGKAENLPIYKDYTVVADREWASSDPWSMILASKTNEVDNGAFLFEDFEASAVNRAYSFGTATSVPIDKNRIISYQSKYLYNKTSIGIGKALDGNVLCLCRGRDLYPFYANAAIWSFLLFPYTLSEFLLERQLKRYKLGTLYPDMVEFRPIVNVNIGKTYNVFHIKEINTGELLYYYINGSIPYNKIGTYLPKGTNIQILVKWDNNRADVTQIKFNGREYELNRISDNSYYINVTLDKSPQKIDIYANEYIRYEDIVQPYPFIFPIVDTNNKVYSWGDKVKVGTEIKFAYGSNLLPQLYELRGEVMFNGNAFDEDSKHIIGKTNIFTLTEAPKYLKDNEPNCILAPQILRIPNASYKILGYIPDLTGKGNHGKLNNFAYTEDSGVAADGSIKFDGTDDHITIPTLAHGGKCVMMKVNWSIQDRLLYDQRNLPTGLAGFSIYTSDENNVVAYNGRNSGSTYIDNVLNSNILSSQLMNITHNITITNSDVTDATTVSPIIGCSTGKGLFANMSLYEFMLFPEIPSEDEIKKLNDVMGIEGGYVESPNYYWDAYGKKNTDTDKNLIADQVSKDIANALEVKNVGYNSESGYNGYIELLFNKWSVFINENRAEIDRTDTTLNITKVYIQNKAIIYCGIGHYLADIPSKYKITGVDDTHPIKFGNDGFPNELILTVTKDGEYEVDWYNYGKNPCIMAGFIGDCNITIEQVAQYPNGLLLDGIEDHAINTVIPAVTDFTVIAKREMVGDAIPSSAFATKGNIYTGGNGNAFLMEYAEPHTFSNYIFGQSNVVSAIQTGKISYLTPTSYNETAITKGKNVDNIGLTIGKQASCWKGVFYKMMLYPKTIDQLSINMLKNLFERDELIDVNNPIFKKEEL
ncbi:hypothetical protein [Bacteroides congonensis]|uniref:hypothetical protein n=2 Tax=Bacteroides congonensis TaxID=1871006 RepID=UPI0023F9C4B2|nr:hypothetical protein [Bacteroides congonensis]